MNPGKVTCEELKKIRKMIADKNNIPYEITECKFSGRCSGTCPFCESEVKYLESQLAKRSSLGKKVLVTGIAVGLSVFSQAQDVQQIDTVDVKINCPIYSDYISATIVDNDGMPLPGVRVTEKGTENSTISDNDGEFSIKLSDKKNGIELSCDSCKLYEANFMYDSIVVIGYGRTIGKVSRGGGCDHKIPLRFRLSWLWRLLHTRPVKDDICSGYVYFGKKFLKSVCIKELGTENYTLSECGAFVLRLEDVNHKLVISLSGYEPVIIKPRRNSLIKLKKLR